MFLAASPLLPFLPSCFYSLGAAVWWSLPRVTQAAELVMLKVLYDCCCATKGTYSGFKLLVMKIISLISLKLQCP